jgi:hypothetical protein
MAIPRWVIRAYGWDYHALTATHDAALQVIDTSIVRVHQHAACIIRNTPRPRMPLQSDFCLRPRG